MSVLQIGSLSDFELLIRVFLVLKSRCESAGTATSKLIILYTKERRCSRLLSASGLQPSWDTMLVTFVIGV